MLRTSGRAKFVRTPAMSTVAAAGRGRPLTSTPTSVVVPPAVVFTSRDESLLMSLSANVAPLDK